MKSFFPGDPEFTWEKYPSLPYCYVISAYVKGSDLYRERLHDQERPVAMVSSLLANQNRDPKRASKAYTFEDFSMYKPRDGGDRADYVYGSAMLKMAKLQILPAWALFCFKEVTASANPEYDPDVCALVSWDAMLLHPIRVGDSYEGMLIALESASEQPRVFVDDNGNKVTLTVPHIQTKAIAEENVILSR